MSATRTRTTPQGRSITPGRSISGQICCGCTSMPTSVARQSVRRWGLSLSQRRKGPDAGVNSTGTAVLSGRLSEVAEDEFDAPFTVAAGTVVVPYVVKLLKAAGFADVIAEGSDYKLAQDWTLGIDSGDMRLSKRLAACNALLDVAGFRAVDEDAYGRPVLRRYREPQDRPVSMTLREGSGARFINEVVERA